MPLLREDKCFKTCILFEASSDEEASLIKPCLIKEGKECEADVIDVRISVPLDGIGDRNQEDRLGRAGSRKRI